MALLHADLLAWYKAQKVSERLPRLSMNMFFEDGKARGYPQLSGPGVKGANTRHVVGWVASLCERCDDGSPEARHRRIAVDNLATFYRVLYTSGYVLTAEQFAEQLLAVQRALRSYQWLAYDAMQAGELMWNIIPKFHYWAELALQARCFNPRWCQCYRGESLIGRVMPLVSAGLNGPFRDTIQARVLEKYIVAFEVQITNVLEI